MIKKFPNNRPATFRTKVPPIGKVFGFHTNHSEQNELDDVKIGVVITTNGYFGIFARQCIESYIRELPPKRYIVLFINESEDEITLNLEREFPEIRVVYIKDQEKNGGLTGTWNQGIDLCFENECEIVILSNDDIIFDGCINSILKSCHDEKGKMRYYGPITNEPGPAQCNKCQYSAIGPEQENDRVAKFKNETVNLNGFFMVFSKEVLMKNKFNDVFFFNPAYPFGGNENEWFKRFQKKGGVPIIVPRTFIYHYKIARWRNKNMNDKCIFTINTGDYEGYNILLQKESYDVLYFTDNFTLVYRCYSQNLIPFFVDTRHKEAKLVQRDIKTRPHHFLPHFYKRSAYLDGNLRVTNWAILNKYIDMPDSLICFEHPERRHAKDEAKKVRDQNLETKKNVDLVLQEFDQHGFKDDIGLTETNCLIRSHHLLRAFGDEWAKKIHMCRRDQVSFDFLLFKHAVNFRRDTNKMKLQMTARHPHVNSASRTLKNLEEIK